MVSGEENDEMQSTSLRRREQEKTIGIRSKYRHWLVIYSILTASLTAVSYGMLFSWPSPAIPTLIKDRQIYDINLEEASYLTVIPPIAAIFICPLYIKLSNTLGRKSSILLLAVPQFVAWMLIAFTKSIWVFYLSRFFSGLADAGIFSLVPVYISEISTPLVRSTWGSSLTVCVYFGQFLVNAIGGEMSIKNTALICSMVPILFVIGFMFVPESPYFYLMKGNAQKARISLQQLRRTENIDREFLKIQNFVETKKRTPGQWKYLFSVLINRRALCAGVFSRLSQQVSGISAFVVYTEYFFDISDSPLSTNTSTNIFYGTSFVMSLIASVILARLGRRKAIMLSLSICTLALYAEMVYFYIRQEMTTVFDVSNVKWIPLAGLIVFIIAFHVGIGIVPALTMGEIFSPNVKSRGVCLIVVTMNVLICTTTKVFQVMQTRHGMYAPFAFFAAFSTINTFLSYYLVPETTGRTLEEIQDRLGRSISLLVID